MGAFHGKAPIAGSAPARQLRLTQTAMSDLPRFAKAKYGIKTASLRVCVISNAEPTLKYA